MTLLCENLSSDRAAFLGGNWSPAEEGCVR